MWGKHAVRGKVFKIYIGGSFTGSPTQNYIVTLDQGVICFVYTKLSSKINWSVGDKVTFSARFSSCTLYQNVTWCRGVKEVNCVE